MGFIELILLVFVFVLLPFVMAFIDILRSEFEHNNKLIWIIAVLLAPVIGSIAYLLIGKKQKIRVNN